MKTSAILSAPIDRLTGWLRRPDAIAADAPDTRAAHRAKLDAICAFLLDHDLEPTAAHLAFAASYVDDRDPRVRLTANAILRERGTITARDIDRITAAVTKPESGADLFSELARELEEKVGECIGAISDSFASTTEYSKALNSAAADLSSAPELTYNRLISLTLDVAETTRKISRRLETAHADTRRLHADLERAVRAAEEDDLTGLLNRRGFMERLEAAVADQPGRDRTVALCDIDNFKVVNDRHGHDTGDRVLRYVARQLRDNLDPQVVVARYGGEEFVCLFEDMVPAQAAAMLDQVRTALRGRSLRSQETGDPIGSITFSAGVALVTDDPAQALRAADAALYAAKHEGKDRVIAAGDEPAA